jgi:hypothetical protein
MKSSVVDIKISPSSTSQLGVPPGLCSKIVLFVTAYVRAVLYR